MLLPLLRVGGRQDVGWGGTLSWDVFCTPRNKRLGWFPQTFIQNKTKSYFHGLHRITSVSNRRCMSILIAVKRIAEHSIFLLPFTLEGNCHCSSTQVERAQEGRVEFFTEQLVLAARWGACLVQAPGFRHVTFPPCLSSSGSSCFHTLRKLLSRNSLLLLFQRSQEANSEKSWRSKSLPLSGYTEVRKHAHAHAHTHTGSM